MAYGLSMAQVYVTQNSEAAFLKKPRTRVKVLLPTGHTGGFALVSESFNESTLTHTFFF